MVRLSDLARDLAHGLRLMRRNPAFAFVAVATLGLALGANSAVFALAHKVLFASLPVQDPEQLVVFSRTTLEQSGLARFPDPWFREIEAEREVFDGVLSRSGSERVTVGTDAGGDAAIGELVSGSYFDVLGIQPHLGRLLTRADDLAPGAHPVVVLSYRFWERRFGGDRNVIGRVLLLSGYPMTIVGVAPPGFDGLDPGQAVDLRVPMAMQAELRQAPSTLNDRRAGDVTVVARLRRGVTPENAEQVLVARWQRYLDETAIPSTEIRRNAAERLVLQPAARGLGLTRRQYGTSLQVLMLITASVLLVACFNVANLLLAAAFRRSREFAVRLAIGAGSAQLLKQVFFENLLIALSGAALGAVLAIPASRLLVRLISTGSTPLLDIEPSWSLLLFHASISLVCAVIIGLAPALTSQARSLAAVLRGDVSGGRGSARRSVYLAVQVALSVIVLIGAALFTRTWHALRTTDVGFKPEGLLTLALSPKNAGLGDEHTLPFFRAARERLLALPGVTGVTFAMVRPLSNASWRADVALSNCCAESATTVSRNVVGPRYFETFAIPVVSGRDFAESDHAAAPKVAIINESLARLYGAARDPLGTTIGIGRLEYRVIGIVKDTKYAHIRETSPPTWFVPYEQHPGVKYLDLYIRTAGDPEAMGASVRDAIATVDNRIALFDVRTLTAQIDDLLVAERSVASLASVFGLVASALAALGVYGILTLLVSERRREIGIRMALGARPREIVGTVTAETSAAVGGGILAGIAIAAALGRYAASLLYGVTPLDAFSLATGALVMIALAALAAALPARRACALDPARALRDA